jgi:hypothetical protein
MFDKLTLPEVKELTEGYNPSVKEGFSNDPAVNFKQLKTRCYIGDKMVSGGDIYHISTTKLNGNIYELYHNSSKDMLHVNIIYSSGKNYLCNFYLPDKINGLYTSVLFHKKGSGVDLLAKFEKNSTKIYFDYHRRVYIFHKYDSNEHYVEFGERKRF